MLLALTCDQMIKDLKAQFLKPFKVAEGDGRFRILEKQCRECSSALPQVLTR